MSLQVDERLVEATELGRLMEQTPEADKSDSVVEVHMTKEGNFKFKLKIRPFSSYDHTRPPKPKKLLHGWLPERRTAALNAPGGKLKSTLIVDQAIETAKLKQMAIIVSAEDEAQDYYGKYYTALKSPESRHYGLDIEEMAEYIVVVDISGTGKKLSASPDNLGQRAEWIDDMVKDVKGMGKRVGFVAFETASRLCYGEENTDFAAAVTIIDHVAMKLDCSCIISHHTAKHVAREKIVDNHSGRGGSALGDNTRSSVAMTGLDKNYGGIRMPMVSQLEINEGRIVEMAHTRNSFGKLMEPRYFRAVSGEGHAPMMEEIPSLRRGTKEAIDWKVEHGAEQVESIGEAILQYMRDEFEAGRDSVGSDLTDNEELRHKVLPGVARNKARSARDQLVVDGKVIKVHQGSGRPVRYYLVGNEPDQSSSVSTSVVSQSDAPSSHYEENGKTYMGELLEDGRPRYIVEDDGTKWDRLAEQDAADY